MKTMRNALLAAGVLAALTVSANAQFVSGTNAEILMAGQVNVDAFTELNGIPGFQANGDLPTVVSAYGFVTGGALFTPPDVLDPPSPTSLFAPGGALSQNARYTFSVTGLTLTGPPDLNFPNVNALYTGGVYSVYYDIDAGGVPGDLQDFSTTGDFTNGLLYLRGAVDVNSSFNLNDLAGVFDGNILFNPADPAIAPNSLNGFLAANPAIVGGFFTNTGFSAQSATGFGEFGTTPQIELIPEPTTMALFGAGLLPLGAFLRRRRGA